MEKRGTTLKIAFLAEHKLVVTVFSQVTHAFNEIHA